jgi:uncharacterized protein (DUF305 family)
MARLTLLWRVPGAALGFPYPARHQREAPALEPAGGSVAAPRNHSTNHQRLGEGAKAVLIPSDRWAVLTGVAVFGILLIAAAGSSLAETQRPAPDAVSGSQHENRAASTTRQAEFDQQFIDMMVPHHEGAVEMARIALARAAHQEIRDLAQAIIQSQDAEINQMKAWRQAWYGSDHTPPMDQMPMLHSMPGSGAMAMTMDMANDVEMLRAAAEPFDRAFIDAMIPHHQSAIDAGRMALQQAARQEIRTLAAAIIADQQREIDQMTSWRQSWYATLPPPEEVRDRPMDMPGMGH